MTQEEKDNYYLEIAKTVATRSTCLFGQVGCVIVDVNDNVISTGYLAYKNDNISCLALNRCFYLSQPDIREPNAEEPDIGKPEQCVYMFPEVNAILAAERSRLQGATLYTYCYSNKLKKTVPVNMTRTLSKIIQASGIKKIIFA